MPLRFRPWGESGPAVAVIHGGPGAPGSAGGLARELGRDFRVLEPFQRPSGGEPLTVARHVEDLREFLAERFPGERPALVGHSWGAMLALCLAAEHPSVPRAVVAVGSGTWDPRSREAFRAEREARVDAALRARLDGLDREIADPDERLARRADLLSRLETVDPLPREDGEEPVDARSNAETWGDMLRLQAEGAYPAGLARVAAPVLMIHGDFDPHPFAGIRDSLRPFVPHLEGVLLARCGHYPWHERRAREEFFRTLGAWLRARCREGAGPA